MLIMLISCRNAKCDGLLTIRRLGVFHPEVLATQLHVIIHSILTEVRNVDVIVYNVIVSSSMTGKELEITSCSSRHFLSSRSLLLLWKDVRTGIVQCKM